MAIVEANGIKICYEDTGGDGEPLLLVMGLGGQLIDWSDGFVAMLVSRGFRVIRHDNRDIGLSTEFDWPVPNRRTLMAGMLAKRPIEVGYRISDMAADAAAFLDAIGVESAHVVGASMGGMISQTMAFGHPEKVRSLTSIMSNTGDRRNGGIHPSILAKVVRAPRPSRADAPEVGTEWYALWAGSAWDREEHLASSQRSVARSWRPDGVDRQTAAIAGSPDRTPMLATITAPTLVIHGLEDKLVVPSGGIATTKAIPGSRLVMFPDMGHDIPRTRWEEIGDAIVVNAARVGATTAPEEATVG